MTCSIGGITVFAIDGPIDFIGTTVTLQQRPGVDDVDVHVVGMQGKDQVLRVKSDYTTALARAIAKAALTGLQGTLVSIVRADGLTWSNVLLLEVSSIVERYIYPVAGGLNSGPYWFEADVRVRSTLNTTAST